MLIAAAGMVAVSVGDDRALDRPPRVDVEIPGRAVQTFRTRDNKIHVVTKMEGLVSYEVGAKPEVLSRFYRRIDIPMWERACSRRRCVSHQNVG